MKSITKYYVSSPKPPITAQVHVDEKGIMVYGPPVLWKFNGQPFSNLTRWLKPDVIEIIP